MHQKIVCQEQKIEELLSNAVRRLQRIRMLESQTTIEDTNNAMSLEGSDVNSSRLMQFIDPPASILKTAMNLQRLMNTHYPEKLLSVVLMIPSQPNESKEMTISLSELVQYKNYRVQWAAIEGLLGGWWYLE